MLRSEIVGSSISSSFKVIYTVTRKKLYVDCREARWEMVPGSEMNRIALYHFRVAVSCIWPGRCRASGSIAASISAALSVDRFVKKAA